MEGYLKQLDQNLRYIKHDIDNGGLKIYCKTKPTDDNPVHSRKERGIQDIPYGNYKVELRLLSKKYFNTSKNAKTLTCAEKHDFINDTGRRTKRLDSRIIELCSKISTIGCERIIRKKIADVSDTSILRLLKKTTLMKNKYK